MSTQPFEPKPTPAKGLVQIGADPQAALEAIIQQRLAEEKARLEKEAGIKKTDYHHFKKPVENMFTKQQRGHTTLLFGGLTWKHEKLLHAAFESLGYMAEAIEVAPGTVVCGNSPASRLRAVSISFFATVSTSASRLNGFTR